MLLSFRATARPFTSVRPAARTPVCIRRVVVRAAAEELSALAEAREAEPAVTDEELSLLIEEEEDVDDLDAIYAEATAGEDEVVDEAEAEALVQAAMEAADLLYDDVDTVTAAAISAELDDDAEDKEQATRVLAQFLEGVADSNEPVDEDELQFLATELPEDAVAELEDAVPGSGADRYEEAPLSAEDKEAIAPLKLSKAELRNLLPADWDDINIDFEEKKKADKIPLPEFRLNLLWGVSTLGISVDQVYSRGQVSPLTEYFFWPRQDAWEDLRQNLEARPWISERDRIVLLNRLTQIINFWQEPDQKPPIEAARDSFPDCAFIVA